MTTSDIARPFPTVFRRPHLLPALALAATLVISLSAAGFVASVGAARERAQFENDVQSASERIVGRIDTYVAMLFGARGLFASSDTVTALDFRHYVEAIDPRRRYPGVQGIGFSQRFTPDERARFERGHRVLDDGAPFRIWPDSARAEYHGIVYLEPLDRRNRAAIGFDMYTDPVRRAAMARARDTGLPTITGRVTLVQEIDTASVQRGFLIYIPVYRTDTTPSTLVARREQLVGFVYSPFRARDLIAGIFGTDRHPNVAFEIFDGVDTGHDALLVHYPPAGAPDGVHPRTMTARIEVLGRPWMIRFTAIRTAHELRPWRVLATMIVTAGVLTGLALFFTIRSTVHARERAERSEAARARFYAAMSHELRTPLNAIVGYNDLLLSGLYGDLTGHQRTGIERSQRAARHLTELVNDALDLSKIEAGKIAMEIEPMIVPALIEDLLHTIKPLADERGCTLRLALEGNARRIDSDPRRVRQIILNLLSNATRFGRGRPVDVRYMEHDGTIVVEVSDQGPGIAREHLAHIFDEFVQLPTVTGSGTGLGLSISRRLATALGGRLDVESEVGVGSTFRLSLPTRPARAAATHG